MLRFRETSPELQQSQQENQGPPPNVMSAVWCQQTQEYYNVAGANKPSTAPPGVRHVHGADTGRNAGTTRPNPRKKICHKKTRKK